MVPVQVEPEELLVEELDEVVEPLVVEPLLDELLVVAPLLVELLLDELPVVAPLLVVPEPPAPAVPPPPVPLPSPECPPALAQAASAGATTAKTSFIHPAYRPRPMAISFSVGGCCERARRASASARPGQAPPLFA
jgi:hypothetical protein